MDFDAACYWRQAGWCVEEKLDGVRCLVSVGETRTVATGRTQDDNGACLPLQKQDVARGWHAKLAGSVLDGELMSDGTFHVFDLPFHLGDDVRGRPLSERKALLHQAQEWLPSHVRLVKSFASVAELGFAFDEGVVWKRLASKYGERWFKAKRTTTVDCYVLKLRGGRVAETLGHGLVQGVPDEVQVGDVIECVAFKVFKSGALRNGRFLRVHKEKSLRSPAAAR
jgi:ATP-dependent DNA ligase